MSDPIDRAAEVIRHMRKMQHSAGMIARALAAEGLLVTPAHDAAVAAKALREAAGDARTVKVHAGGGNLVTSVHVLTADALRARADRIGASHE